MDDIELLVSEVVTNAVLHGPEAHPGGIGLDILEFDHMLRFEVRDQGPGFTPSVPERPSPDGEGGRGLYLLDAVADRWGVNGDGVTLVWFELAIDRNGSMSNGTASRQRIVSREAKKIGTVFGVPAEQYGSVYP